MSNNNPKISKKKTKKVKKTPYVEDIDNKKPIQDDINELIKQNFNKRGYEPTPQEINPIGKAIVLGELLAEPVSRKRRRRKF